MKRDMIEEYYDQYLDEVIREYIRSYGKALWLRADQLTPYKSKSRIPWSEKKTDGYILDSCHDKGILGRDIEDRGTYWPVFITEDRIVMMGSHRVEALASIGSRKALLCIELNHNHFDKTRKDKPKYEFRKPIGIEPRYMRIPACVEIPKDSVSRMDEYILLKTNRWDKSNKYVELPIRNYRDLMDIIRITPHWLKDYMYEEAKKGLPIEPRKHINDIREFSRWINIKGE